MSILEIKHSRAGEFEIQEPKMFDDWEKNGKIHVTGYILVLDLMSMGRHTRTHTHTHTHTPRPRYVLNYALTSRLHYSMSPGREEGP